MFDRFPDGFQALIQGASRGIGLECVRQLLAEPRVGRVYATARRPERAERLQALADEHPERLVVLRLDVADEASIDDAAATVAARSPRLHLLFNVAGLLHDEHGMAPEKRLHDVRLENLEKSFRVNAFGPLLVARAFAQLLCHREHAVLANMSARVGSIGDNGLGGWYAYRGAKAAQNMFTRGIAVELGRRSRTLICVALHPGTTDTALSEPFQARVPEGKLFTREYTVSRLFTVIDGLSPEASGSFLAWDGQAIPW
ncbi:SDR family oxidoreductase [Aquisalimonas asiatica]|uniref:NAD(P)-dependent dehydrogenase, short-chain alcohol dehydrogenase family n=1 Tax=Aquisalimonas asiatica TaxID=406100 RepID=A0A1H8Q608_9GAMM|nr:SDR family oxidoreductase [Aquisalimonas asiatica]SEO49401.1 NAD(P)-dependent dehydrogenase, short-chain alcohol dehydrogenase family [Aquisalimonas asiatica]